MSRLILRPMTSFAAYPKIFSAAGFMDSTVPRSSMVRIPSTAVSRMARNRASLSLRARSARSFWIVNSIFSILSVRALVCSRACRRAPLFEPELFCWFFTPKRENYGQNSRQFQPPRLSIRRGSGDAKGVAAIFGWGLAEHFFEDAVEVRQRLEPDFKRNLAHAQIGIEQQILRFFNPHPRQVIRKIDPGNLLEHFAKIKGTHIDGLGHLTERQVFGLMLLNVFPGASDGQGLSVALLHRDLVALDGKVLRENAQ